MSRGPVIYNLFPKLAGAMKGWPAHIRRAREMGFDTVYVNPFHYPGFSGSIYAPKDYYAYDPLLLGIDRRPGHEQLRGVLTATRELGMRFMMDLVINHTSIDCPLIEKHPTWFRRNAEGKLENPTAIDPADARKVTTWGDLAEVDNFGSADRDALWDYWTRLVLFYQEMGVSDFRGDAAYKVPPELWARIIQPARARDPQARFFAETLGCKLEEVAPLAAAGFDYTFNSVKWWDMGAPWLIEQFEMFRKVAPSISFPESHDTPRLAEELNGNLEALKSRYAFAAFFSTGVMTVFGYEFAYRKPLDVVKTNPFDAGPRSTDISSYIAGVNRIKAAHPIFNVDPETTQLSGPEDRVLVLKKVHGDERVLLLVNRSLDKEEKLELPAWPQALGLEAAQAARARDISPEHPLTALQVPLSLTMAPAQIRVLHVRG